MDRDASTVTVLTSIYPAAKLSVCLGFMVMNGKSEAITTEGLRCYMRACSELDVAWGGRNSLGPE